MIPPAFVPINPENALAEITAASQERLQADPDVCVKFITQKYNVVERGGSPSRNRFQARCNRRLLQSGLL